MLKDIDYLIFNEKRIACKSDVLSAFFAFEDENRNTKEDIPLWKVHENIIENAKTEMSANINRKPYVYFIQKIEMKFVKSNKTQKMLLTFLRYRNII